MIINIHSRNSIIRTLQSSSTVPNRQALMVSADDIRLEGARLKAIQVSTNNGYNYSTMKDSYKGTIYVKSQLERVGGYVFKMSENCKVAGFLSEFGSAYGLFQADLLDCSGLVCDVTDMSGLFVSTDMEKQPILQNRPYIFSETFKHCVSLPELDLSMISNDNLYNSKFYEFLPTTSQIKFSRDCPKELEVMILDARYEN